MKKIFLIISMIACLCGCSKNPAIEGETVDMSKLIGKWADVSDKHYGYTSDSATYYTFNDDGTCVIGFYDALEGNTTSETFSYTLNIKDGLTIIRDKSDISKNSNYIVLKLDDKEMKWQSTELNLQESDWAIVYLEKAAE